MSAHRRHAVYGGSPSTKWARAAQGRNGGPATKYKAAKMSDENGQKLRRPGSVLPGRSRDTWNGISDRVVYVVDDDDRVRAALEDLLASCGYSAQTFASATEFIGKADAQRPSCLVLDVDLPDINGLELQRQLSHEAHPPIVFITGHGDIPSSVRAMKEGAVDFLPKPFSQDQLLTAIEAALARDRSARAANAKVERLRARYALLTPRERETLPLIVSGLRNKQAAAVLGISLVTTQIHRGNIMRKMQAGSLSDLVRMSETLQIPQHKEE
jgi:FixJ family two-component response regulator